MMKRRTIPVAAICGLVTAFAALSWSAAAPKKAKVQVDPQDARWLQVATFESDASDTIRTYEVHFTQAHWRVGIATSVSKNAGAGAAAANIHVALMDSPNHSGDSKPKTWEQAEQLIAGSPGDTVVREMNNGVDSNGNGLWYAIQVTGEHSHFKIIFEQAVTPGDPATQPSDEGGKKKKKSK